MAPSPYDCMVSVGEDGASCHLATRSSCMDTRNDDFSPVQPHQAVTAQKQRELPSWYRLGINARTNKREAKFIRVRSRDSLQPHVLLPARRKSILNSFKAFSGSEWPLEHPHLSLLFPAELALQSALLSCCNYFFSFFFFFGWNIYAGF